MNTGLDTSRIESATPLSVISTNWPLLLGMGVLMLGAGLQSTLLKVGHHGSITSTRPEFLTRVAPQWAVISSGLHNRYGHPRQEVLAELQAAHIRTYRTDINGATCFVLDGKTTAPEPNCGWLP